MQFVRLSDAQRLGNCLIQYKGEPVYIEYVDEPVAGVYVAHGFTVEGRKSINIDLSKEMIHPPKFIMGFANVWRNKELHVVQMFRNPARRTNLGVCTGNSYFIELEGSNDGRPLAWQSVFLSTGFVNTQKDQFLTLDQIVENGRGALSSEFALVRATLNAYRLHWENGVIGEYDSKERIITVYPPYSWVKESIERLIHNKQENTRVIISA